MQMFYMVNINISTGFQETVKCEQKNARINSVQTIKLLYKVCKQQVQQ